MSRVTVASDNWNRADNGVEVGNSNWQQENGGFGTVGIVSNTLPSCTAAPASNKAHASWIGTGTWAADCWAESRIVSWGGFTTNHAAQAACRFTSAGGFNLYAAGIAEWGGSISGAATEIVKEVAGVSTQLSFVSGNADGWANNDLISIEAVGTSITVCKNGTPLRSVTDSSVTGTSSRGVTCGGGDDWAAGTFSSGSTSASVDATESSDTASISASATTGATVAASDSSDTASISAQVTTGASIAAADGADTDAIVAAIWTTAQIAAAESSDTAAISTTVTTGAAIAATESSDNAAITTDNQTTAAVAATDSADNAAITTSVTTGAAIAALDNSDTAAITVDANTGVTSAAVAATESADSTIVVAEATVGAAIAASESADTADIGTQVIAVAAIGAAESSDAAAITAVVATVAQIDATESSDYGGSPDVPVVNVGSGGGVMNRRQRRAAQFAPDAFPAPAVFTITRAGIHAIESPDDCIITALQFLELGKSAGDIAELAAAHEHSLKAAQEAEEAEFAEFFGAGGIVEQFMPTSAAPEVRAQSAGHGVVQRKRIEKEVIERDADGIPTKIIETEIVLFGPGEQELPIRRRVEKEVLERDADGVATKVIETEIAL